MSANGPRRLLDYGDELNGILRNALEAERADTIDPARLDRIAQAITAAGSAAPTVHAPSAPAPSAAAGTASLASKGPFALLAAATIGGLVVVGLVKPEPLTPAHVYPTAPVVTIAAPQSSTEEPPTVSPADLPSAPALIPSAAPRSPKPAMSTGAPVADADEIALLARAHDALHVDPARSLALCREHEARFAAGHFAQEREAVAIEALVYLKRTDDARRRWTEFQRRYPTSSHRVHLASLLSAPPSP